MSSGLWNASDMRASRCGLIAAVLLLAVFAPSSAWAQEDAAAPAAPTAGPAAAEDDGALERILTAAEDATDPDRISGTLLIFFLLTILSLAPAIMITTTSFTRIIVVLGFLRQAMATQQSPPNQVLIWLSLILTFFIMAPTYQQVFDEAVEPYVNEEIGSEEALERGVEPIRAFMFRQVRERDLALFLDIARAEPPETEADIPTVVLVPAFILNELRTAFQIGFIIYIPFLIIDMVVASILLSMGMMMLPPVLISIPFKILLFVMVDGWNLLTASLVNSFVL